MAQCGKTALMMGDRHRGTGRRWFQRLWDAQPALPDRLFYVWSAENQSLVTDYPAARAGAYVVEAQGSGTLTCGGIGGISVRLSPATAV